LERDSPVFERLEDLLEWYSEKSRSNQRWFKLLKVIEIIAAALIPFVAGLGPYLGMVKFPLITGGLGVVVVVLESLQSLYQFQHNWITYRPISEGLKHEKYLWMSEAGPYADVRDPDALLAERVESLISTEHVKWVSANEKMERQRPSRGAEI